MSQCYLELTEKERKRIKKETKTPRRREEIY
jgi:hypothetical protein